jgi:hypothetical protein
MANLNSIDGNVPASSNAQATVPSEKIAVGDRVYAMEGLYNVTKLQQRHENGRDVEYVQLSGEGALNGKSVPSATVKAWSGVASDQLTGQLGLPIGRQHAQDVPEGTALVNAHGEAIAVGDFVTSGNHIYEVASLWQLQYEDGHAVTYVKLKGDGPENGVSASLEGVRKSASPATVYVEEKVSEAGKKVDEAISTTSSFARGLWNNWFGK